MHLIKEVIIGGQTVMFSVNNDPRLFPTVKEALKAIGLEEAIVFWTIDGYIARDPRIGGPL